MILFRNNFASFFQLTLLFALCPGFLIAHSINLIKQRITDGFLVVDATSLDQKVRKHLTMLKPEGYWKNVTYEHQGGGVWFPIDHLQKVTSMAIAFNSAESRFHQEPELEEAINRAVDFWFRKDPKPTTSWWWREIGIPLQLGPIGILMEESLPQDLLEKIIAYLANNDGQGYGMTGANLYWHCEKQLWLGILTGSEDLITRARDGFASELVVNEQLTSELSSEGIKPDWSWWQHLNTPLPGNYGLQATARVIRYAKVFSGTPYAFERTNLDILAAFVEDGLHWFIRRGYFDVSGKDRTHTRPDALKVMDEHIQAIADGAAADPRNASVYNRLVAHMQERFDGSKTGNRYFWISEFMSHRREDYMVGLKLKSVRTRGPEALNNENVKGQYMYFGGCYPYLNGDEYYNIFPSWDYAHIPGTTTRHKQDPTLTADFPSEPGTTTFVGGASNGRYGAACLDLDYDQVTGKKAWFFFDDVYVALGAGIASESRDEIHTTLNQCHLRGEVYAALENKEKPTQQQTGLSEPLTLKQSHWLHHDQVGYVFPDKDDIVFSAREQTGRWSEINHSRPDTMVSNEVFTLYLNHGQNPQRETYRYLVLPGANREETGAFASTTPVAIVANTSSLQAVYHKNLKLGGIVFYAADSTKIRPGLTVTVDAPCVLLLDEGNEREFAITAANPNNQPLDLNVELHIHDSGEHSFRFHLPDGPNAGASITRRLYVNP